MAINGGVRSAEARAMNSIVELKRSIPRLLTVLSFEGSYAAPRNWLTISYKLTKALGGVSTLSL